MLNWEPDFRAGQRRVPGTRGTVLLFPLSGRCTWVLIRRWRTPHLCAANWEVTTRPSFVPGFREDLIHTVFQKGVGVEPVDGYFSVY